MAMAPPLFLLPLRWESTGEQWWYATPIDWAAANGLYDVVRELLHFDTNLLIKLTSLRRLRRLESVWDDDEAQGQFNHIAKCRCYVAKKLLLEGETKGGKGENSLIRAGYGGWLLYTAASAGDVSFTMELLEKHPLLVFGEGEYGVTDMFYAAARSKNSELFRFLLDFALSSSTMEVEITEPPLDFRLEMMNRAVHCAAKGGNLEILKQLLPHCSDVFTYRDALGSTILHSAAGRGQIQVVKDLVASFDIISTTDGHGNTALHVAAYRGQLAVVEFLVHECPSLTSLSNYHGDTFLHLAVAGFKTPAFRRLDKQIELMKHLIHCELMSVRELVNVKNNDGRTVLHMAVIETIQYNLVELILSVPSINLNICDVDGLTPLDLLKQQPRSPSSEILIRRLISAGGISNRSEYVETNGLSSIFKMLGMGSSPGTSFRVPDAEIFLYTGIENASDSNFDQGNEDFNICLDEFGECDSVDSSDKKLSPVNQAAKRLKFFLQWPKGKARKASANSEEDDDKDDRSRLFDIIRNSESKPIPLRNRYSNIPHSTIPIPPSPSAKKKFVVGLMHGVIQTTPKSGIRARSPSSHCSQSSVCSSMSMDSRDIGGIGGVSWSNRKVPISKFRQDSFDRKMLMMNQYFCFGTQGLAVDEKANQNYKCYSSLVA